jgi:hypothetical protein
MNENLVTLDTRQPMDPQLKQLLRELGDVINEALADSERVSEAVSRIKKHGYDIFLVLEATIKQDEKSQAKGLPCHY